MTAMAGGAADKAGNQYDDLWTALRIADLLTGSATRLRPEPPGPAGRGIEFEIYQDGQTWGEQVKGSLSANNWTINCLNKEGVLELRDTAVRQSRRMAKAAPEIGLVPSSNATKVLATLTREDGKQVVFILQQTRHRWHQWAAVRGPRPTTYPTPATAQISMHLNGVLVSGSASKDSPVLSRR